jgi:YD repeat-containing protein
MPEGPKNEADAVGANAWLTRTIETANALRPTTIYTNAWGEAMLTVNGGDGFSWNQPAGVQQYATFQKLDGEGRVILEASPSAVSGYDDTHLDLMDEEATMSNGNIVFNYRYLNDTSGQIQLTDYVADGQNGAGYVLDRKLRRGETGNDVLQDLYSYAPSVSGVTQVESHTTFSKSVFKDPTGPGYRDSVTGEAVADPGAVTVTYDYGWTGALPTTITTHLPQAAQSQHRPGTDDVQVEQFDILGRLVSSTDADGSTTTNAYDDANQTITIVVDASHSNGAFSAPLALTTVQRFDDLGRPVRVTAPGGTVTYTFYNDTQHEVRVSPGWHLEAGGWHTSLPVQVVRQDFDHDYVDQLTFALPANASSTDGGDDVPPVVEG